MNFRALILVLACAATSLSVLADLPRRSNKEEVMFDGKSLEHWESLSKWWRVEDGMITGGSVIETIPQNDFLATKRSFTNFVLRLKLKITGGGGFVNSGVQIRSQRAPDGHEMIGYQVDAGEGWWGKMYDESRRNKVIAEATDLDGVTAAVKKDDWNEYVIEAIGPRIRSWINGIPAIDYTEADPSIPLDGRIGVQVHGGGKTLVQVKDVTIEELAPPAPGSIFIGAPEPAKAVKASPLSPQEQQASFTLPTGFEIELVAAEEPGISGKFITVAWDQKGRMWSMTAFDYPVDGNENPAAAAALYANPGKDKVLVWDAPLGSDPIPPGGIKPRVFADGLAIPLGILPYQDGCYVQHGPDIVRLRDTDGDGKADKREVVLSGFGVQDSHLFPHQFMRAPGNWIWFAQGAFNSGTVKNPNGEQTRFDATRMARFRYDGSEFDITSQGPCNIWGLVLNGEGEAWIQEANDYGYPAMPFHAYANYPGCSDRLFKSYAPEFPGTAPHFKMGGTGLSGLALSDARGAWPGAYADVMYVANPITREIQALKIHRDGPRYRLEKLPTLVRSSDEMFRPVAIHFGPDGCLYIVDWYNKIISHNEVPRNHPERDKTRGRIWRVRYKEQRPFAVPDFTRLSGEELLQKLGGDSSAQSHLSWQAIGDRHLVELAPTLSAQVLDQTKSAAQRIGALWALEALQKVDGEMLRPLLSEQNRSIRREAIRAWGNAKLPNLVSAVAPLSNDPDPEVRAQVIRTVGETLGAPYGIGFGKIETPNQEAISVLVNLGNAPLEAPLAPSTRNNKPQKVGEAYERDFERYLVRLFLETQPQAVAAWLDSPAAATVPVENRLLAALSLEPKKSVTRLAGLLPQLNRPPGSEELLRLVQFVDEPGASDSLKAALNSATTQIGVLEALLAIRTRFDAEKIASLLTDVTVRLLDGDAAARAFGLRLVTGFSLSAVEPNLVSQLERNPAEAASIIRALSEIGSRHAELFAQWAEKSSDQKVRDEALAALASCEAEDARKRYFELWPQLTSAERRSGLSRLATSKLGAKSVVNATRNGTIAKSEVDANIVDKLQTVLPDDSDLATLMQELASLFRPVLSLNGDDEACAETGLTLEGPLTVETWVRLAPGIGNQDGILAAPGQIDLNFYDGKFRVWAGPLADVAAAKKSMLPDAWTHVAATRDSKGIWRIYIDGELDAVGSKPAAHKIESPLIGFTNAPGGTAGALSEFRIWNRERTADEIRVNFDRSFEDQPQVEGIVFYAPGAGPWGKLRMGARIAKTSDFPPLLTATEAAALDTRFAHFRTLAEKPGNPTAGKAIAAVCQACHLMGGTGNNIGPTLNSVGAMGTEAILRNILTPNAAMEAGYRIYRVELKSGELVDAFFVSEDATGTVVRLPGAQDRRISKSDIRNTKYLRRSLMPEGLLDSMSPEQVTDLFAYLKTLK